MEERRILEELKIVPLLTKFVRGEDMTVLEEKTVEIWLNESSANRAFFEQLQDKEHVARELLKMDAAEATTSSELQKLHGLLKKQSNYKRVVIWASAAAVLLFFSLTILLYRYHQSRNSADETVRVAIADIDPGKDQATLTFDDGKIVSLNGKELKTDNKGTSYLGNKAISENVNKMATLSTPRKGQYKTTLPDGTKVWLNAESSLKFPTQFTGNVRPVELIGEGYFEVAHDKSKPFFVSSRGQQVKVLGTKFNINAYENEPAILTTLVSGSVEVSTLRKDMPTKLSPGQQSQLNSLSPLFLVIDVDTEPFTA
uniref:FecR family protein n=1 Tax=Chryseobacterium sp. TaxID=1871047 RepID=UPI0033429B3C